jgi:hypothetical protein
VSSEAVWELGPHRVRLLEPEDVEDLVRYWTATPRSYLFRLGVDLDRVGEAAEVRARFGSYLVPSLARSRVVYVLTGEDDDVLAYSNACVTSEGIAHAHVHTLARSKAVVRSVFASFVPVCQDMCTRLAVSSLVFETQPDNRGINGLLSHFGLVGELREIDIPDGLARPGPFLVRRVTRSQVDGLASER